MDSHGADPKVIPPPTICETCIEYMADETGEDDYEVLELLLMTTGEFCGDHNCDHVEEPEIPCDCPAHK